MTYLYGGKLQSRESNASLPIAFLRLVHLSYYRYNVGLCVDLSTLQTTLRRNNISSLPSKLHTFGFTAIKKKSLEALLPTDEVFLLVKHLQDKHMVSKGHLLFR